MMPHETMSNHLNFLGHWSVEAIRWGKITVLSSELVFVKNVGVSESRAPKLHENPLISYEASPFRQDESRWPSLVESSSSSLIPQPIGHL